MSETNDTSKKDAGGRFAYDGLERVIHEKARLGILASLLAHADGLSFTELRESCRLTDGNLNRHLKVLVEAGLVEIAKGSQGNRPQTVCRVTSTGRERFQEYLAALEQVIADAAASTSDQQKRLSPRWNPG